MSHLNDRATFGRAFYDAAIGAFVLILIVRLR
jgi:hypothetical protein